MDFYFQHLVASCVFVVLVCCVQLTQAYTFWGIKRARGTATVPMPDVSSGRGYSYRTSSSTSTTRRYIYAPPGSGYARPEDEVNEMPDTYEPMLEYPGTMRPGRTPENMPYHDLPLGDIDVDPIPWPHFQQIEWHHRWDPPHPHPVPMEEFIDQLGRWATPEMEAEMRAGNRRQLRKRQELQEQQKREKFIMDDDDDAESDEPQELGEGIFGQLGTEEDEAPPIDEATSAVSESDELKDVEEEEEEEEDAGDINDFLLDLGLDMDDDDDDDDDAAIDDDDDDDGTIARNTAQPITVDGPGQGLEDVSVGDDEDEGASTTSTIATGASSIEVDDEEEVVGLDDEDELSNGSGSSTVPLEDFGDENALGSENFFDDGGFDLGDDDFDVGDGGDSW